MMALSIRQPWAWFIVQQGPDPLPKTMENRCWTKQYSQAQLRLRPAGSWFMVHAAKGMTKVEYQEAIDFAKSIGVTRLPREEDLDFGGIIGSARHWGLFHKSENPWFTGPLALKISDAYPIPFRAMRGQLGFFDVNGEYR